jgi:hypothetical protein
MIFNRARHNREVYLVPLLNKGIIKWNIIETINGTIHNSDKIENFFF